MNRGMEQNFLDQQNGPRNPNRLRLFNNLKWGALSGSRRSKEAALEGDGRQSGLLLPFWLYRRLPVCHRKLTLTPPHGRPSLSCI
jgi:hypothetical protein